MTIVCPVLVENSADVLRLIIIQAPKTETDLGPGTVRPGRGVLQARRAAAGAGQSLSAGPEVCMGIMREMTVPWQPRGAQRCARAAPPETPLALESPGWRLRRLRCGGNQRLDVRRTYESMEFITMEE